MSNKFEKAFEVLGEEIVAKVMNLTDDATDKFITKMETLIAEKKQQRKEQEANRKKPTRAEMVAAFNGYGFIVPSNAKFFHIAESDVKKGCKNCFGFQIGEYVHSCHVDSTDYIVLLMLDDKHHTWVEEFDGLWMKEVK